MKNNIYVKIHAENIESGVYDQLKLIENHLAFNGLIAIMPDTHVGKGCVIGFTAKFNDLVIPNIIGVDIGCGVVAYPLGMTHLSMEFEEIDKRIRDSVPLGFNSRKSKSKFLVEMSDTILLGYVKSFYLNNKIKMKQHPVFQLGTLGGGNHFIEIARGDKTGELYLLIHSGSRNFGHTVATYYQKKAVELCKSMSINVPKDLEYLPMEFGGKDYLHYMKVAQQYASLNRKIMIQHILERLQIPYSESKLIESVHNFIGEDNIVRKGAIAAYEGQKVIIPFNMAEGSIIGVGKSNADYNFSAPHGAGRTSSRNAIKQQLVDGEVTMEMFKDSMEGIFSTCIDKKRIDESKFAYKEMSSIMHHLKETVEIKERLTPIYNLKG